jgi:hypothetical protein
MPKIQYQGNLLDLSDLQDWEERLVIVQAKTQLIGILEDEILYGAMHYIANLRLMGDGQGNVQAGMDGPLAIPYDLAGTATIHLEEAEYTFLRVSEQEPIYKTALINLYTNSLRELDRQRSGAPEILLAPPGLDVNAILGKKKKGR